MSKYFHNEKGGFLPYVLMIMLVLGVFVPVLLSLTSNQQLANQSSENEKKANSLAVSGMETFIAYIKTYTNGDKASFFNNYRGWGTFNITTPEGEPVVYSLSKSAPVNNIVNVTSMAQVGSGNLAKTKTVSYSFDLSPCQGTYITNDPNQRVRVPINFNQIYVEGSTVGVPKETKVNQLSVKEIIGNQIVFLSNNINNQINQYINQAISCTNCNENDINNKIKNNNSPVIIKAGNLSISGNVIFGSSSKAVILILDNLTATNNANLKIYGSLIVLNNIYAYNNFDNWAYKVNGSYGDLWVKGSVTMNNGTNLDLDGSLFSGSLVLHNNAHIRAQSIVVENSLNVYNNLDLLTTSDIYTGSISANNNADISVTAGDLFVKNDLTTYNNADLTTGGIIAIGGNMTLNNRGTIRTGGATTSLITGKDGGSGGGGCSGGNWNIGRKE
jgi:hypothetical protein